MVASHFVYDLYLHFVEECKFPVGKLDYYQGVGDLLLSSEYFYHNASSLIQNFGYERYLFDQTIIQLHIWAKASEEKLSKELHYMDPDGGNISGLDTNIVVPRIVSVC